MKRVAAAVGAVLIMAGLAVVPGASAADAAPARCTTSAALFANPLRPQAGYQPHWYNRNVQLTANRGTLWAGVAYEQTFGNRYALFVWRPGQTRVTVLATFRHPEGIQGGVIAIAGITTKQVVVAAVSRDRQGDRIGYAWYHGHRTRLQQAKTWESVVPVGVTNHGTIFGWARSTSGQYYLVRWADRLAPYRIVRRMGTDGFSMTVLPNGDVVYTGNAGVTHVLLASGRTAVLSDSTSATLGTGIAAGAALIAQADGGIKRWDLGGAVASPVRPSATLVPYKANHLYRPVLAGPGGDLVFADQGGFIRTASGRVAALPHRILFVSAISDYGTVAVTLRGDGLVHFLRCR